MIIATILLSRLVPLRATRATQWASLLALVTGLCGGCKSDSTQSSEDKTQTETTEQAPQMPAIFETDTTAPIQIGVDANGAGSMAPTPGDSPLAVPDPGAGLTP